MFSTSVSDGADVQVQVITGPERRRRWSEDEKRTVVLAAFAPGAVVTSVARRADVWASQIYRWRRELGGGPGGFAEVVVRPDSSAEAAIAPPAIEIEFVGLARVRIPPSIPAALASSVVKALVDR